MKAEIDREGHLKISAETELEAYALGCWAEKNMTDHASYGNFLVSWGLDGEGKDESRD